MGASGRQTGWKVRFGWQWTIFKVGRQGRAQVEGVGGEGLQVAPICLRWAAVHGLEVLG